MNIEYPKTELLVVLGTKVYPLYTTEDSDFVHSLLSEVQGRDRLLKFRVAIRKSHNNGLCYPACGDDPVWTDWTVQKRAIKSFVKLPEPKIKIDYDTEDYD